VVVRKRAATAAIDTDDIDGACGQLAGQVQDRTRRVLRRQETQA